MATVKLTSYAINEVTPFGVSINLHLAGDNPVPPVTIEAKTLDEVRAALDAYAVTAKATGKRVQISAVHLKGRKINGFDAANFDRNLNV